MGRNSKKGPRKNTAQTLYYHLQKGVCRYLVRRLHKMVLRKKNSEKKLPKQLQFINVIFQAHIASTFAALQVLLMLGDDLSRVDSGRLMLWVSGLQTSSGSFLGAGEKQGQGRKFGGAVIFTF